MIAGRSTGKYTAVLRWKAGEQAAVATIDAARATAFLPIIEPTPKAYEHVIGRPPAFKGVLRNAAKKIGLAWSSRPFFYDTHLLTAIGRGLPFSPVIALGEEVRGYGLTGSPVLRIEQPATVWQQCLRECTTDSVLGIRVRIHDLAGMIGRARLIGLMNGSDLAPERSHLFVDLGVVADDIPPMQALRALPYLGRWQGLTVLAGSFPKDLTRLDAGVHQLPRHEWALFQELIEKWPAELGALDFGDFGTQHAEFQEPKSPCYPSLSVRYANENEWLVIRGYSNQNKAYGGSRQFISHARYLMQDASFAGADFSSGDSYIAGRLASRATTGNLTTWLAAGMNHHISLTVDQVRALAVRTREAVAVDRRQQAVQASGHPRPGPGAP